MSATVASLMLQLRTDLSGFRKMFNQLGARATAWWPEQEPAKRTKFLSSCAPDADTAAALAPRWTAEGLSHGDYMTDYMKVFGTPKGEAGGADDLADLLGRAAAKGKDLAGKSPSQLSGADAASVVIIASGAKFGQQLAVEGPNPVIDKLLQRGGALRTPEFEAVVRMLCLQLNTLSKVLDAFRCDVLGQAANRAIGLGSGCTACGVMERKDGSAGPMLVCGGCGVAQYCGADCQRSHWRLHKPECKRPEKQAFVLPQPHGDCCDGHDHGHDGHDHGHSHGDGCDGHDHEHSHGDGCNAHDHTHSHGDGCDGHEHGRSHGDGCDGHEHGHSHGDGCDGHEHGHSHGDSCDAHTHGHSHTH